jgi:hypothetical protein
MLGLLAKMTMIIMGQLLNTMVRSVEGCSKSQMTHTPHNHIGFVWQYLPVTIDCEATMPARMEMTNMGQYMGMGSAL